MKYSLVTSCYSQFFLGNVEDGLGRNLSRGPFSLGLLGPDADHVVSRVQFQAASKGDQLTATRMRSSQGSLSQVMTFYLPFTENGQGSSSTV